MENNERDRKLDQWLDEALSQYSAAEPRLGLEQRVLAHMSAEEKARAGRRTWWRWMPAFAAIAAVLIVAVAVRPYWEQKQKSSSASDTAGYAVAPDRAEQKAQSMAKQQARESEPPRTRATLQTNKGVLQDNSNSPARAVEAHKREVTTTRESVAPNDAVTLAKDSARMDSATATAPAKKEAKVANEAAGTNLFSAPAAPVITQQPSGAAGGVLVGGLPSTIRVTSPDKSETVEVQPAPIVVDAQHGIVATEKVATMPDVSQTMKAMKVHAKPKGPLAKKLEENVETVTLPGMGTVRMNLKTVPLGPSQQFPSPSPLSKEEEMMLAAAKKLKNVPVTDQDQSKSDAESIVIKKIDIAPLPGPPK